MRGAGDVGRGPQRRRHRFDRGAVVEPEGEQRLLGFRARQNLDGHVGHGGERPPRARQDLAQVVAGDVLDHPAARLERLAAPRHGGQPKEMIARGARLDAARARDVGGEHAAERPFVGAGAEQRPAIHRLKRQLLSLAADQRLDLGDRRAPARGEHQLLRLIERDAGQLREVEREIPLRRAPDAPFRAAPDDLQGLALARRPFDDRGDILGVARAKRVSH